MFIIFGIGGRAKTVKQGDFDCPICKTERPYALKSVANYFSLFFIPIIKVKDLGEYVECAHCRQKYNASVLNFKAPNR